MGWMLAGERVEKLSDKLIKTQRKLDTKHGLTIKKNETFQGLTSEKRRDYNNVKRPDGEIRSG